MATFERLNLGAYHWQAAGMDPDEVVDEFGRTRRYRRLIWQWKAYRRLVLGDWANWPDAPIAVPGHRGWPFWPTRPGTGARGSQEADGA